MYLKDVREFRRSGGKEVANSVRDLMNLEGLGGTLGSSAGAESVAPTARRLPQAQIGRAQFSWAREVEEKDAAMSTLPQQGHKARYRRALSSSQRATVRPSPCPR